MTIRLRTALLAAVAGLCATPAAAEDLSHGKDRAPIVSPGVAPLAGLGGPGDLLAMPVQASPGAAPRWPDVSDAGPLEGRRPAAVPPQPIEAPSRIVVEAAPPALEPPVAPDAIETGAVEAAEEVDEEEEEATEEGAGEDAAWARSRTPMPYDIIRSIQFLQDQVSRGNDRAIRVQALLLQRFAPVIVAADASVWTDDRNVRAAILLALSGGPPAVLRTLLKRGVLDGPHRGIAEGALAYVEGDLEGAREILSGLGLDAAEPGLAAHISLVLAQIHQNDDPEEAVRHLDRARLLAPGGLIEEAALRLQVLVAEGLGRHDDADALARRYFDRYSRSSYAANFEARFAAVFAGRGKTDAEAAVATMADVVDRLPDPRKQALFLAVSRRSLVEGNLPLAALAAGRALAFDTLAEADRQRGSLYQIAATLGSADPSDARPRLDAIDRAALHPEDLKLLEAADTVLAAIDRSAEADPGAGRETVTAAAPAFERAEQLLNEVASDLGKTRR